MSLALPIGDRSSTAGAARRPRHYRLREDCEKYYSIELGTPRPPLHRRVRVWLTGLVLPCIAVYRLGQLALVLWERNRLLGALPMLLYRILQLVVRVLLHVEIARECRIGPGLYLAHPYGIVVGGTEIGANFSITHGVTVGKGLGVRGGGVPVIGDDVWIGTGSVLTGPIHVGNGASVSAGSILSRDVPPGALVAGNPARVIAATYDNRALLGYSLPASSGGRAPAPAHRWTSRRRVAARRQVEEAGAAALGGDFPAT